MNDLIYKIGVSLMKDIGPIGAKNLIAHCGSPQAIYSESVRALEKIPGIGTTTAKKITSQKDLSRAEKELSFIQRNHIQVLYYLDTAYPFRLKQCLDSPILLYVKGNIDLNKSKIISVVGTRKASEYGTGFCQRLIDELAPQNISVISGLAYGIDIAAHRAALKNKLPTAAVVAHGLDQIYPAVHRKEANKMLENGAIISEFISGTVADKENFPKRNRIVAGLSDATIVIESASKGGSLITAELANSYNRDVFALPGRINDHQSVGCNHLIKTNKAHLLESYKDVNYIMGWNDQPTPQHVQTNLFTELDSDEEHIVSLLRENRKMSIDTIGIAANFPISKVSSVLLNLEFAGVVKSLPGKVYQLV